MVMSPFQNIRFWFNAFIPAHIPGYTEIVQEGPYKEKTALVNLGAPGLVLTDQRPFSHDVSAEARLHSFGQVAFTRGIPRLEQVHRTQVMSSSNQTRDAADQPAVEHMAMTLYTHRTLTSSSPAAPLIRTLPGYGIGTPLEQMLYIHVDCRSTIPDAEFARRLGEIAYRGIVSIDLAQRAVEFHGHVGRFPAYELYVAVDKRRPQPVFLSSPVRGEGAYDGTFVEPRPIRGRAAWE
jgi:hypothetical protein